MLTILKGPAGAGKSQLLQKKMVEASIQKPTDHFIAIVPEQSTLQMQRAVVAVHPEHVVMNIDIVSFERLAHKVLEEQRVSDTVLLNDTGRLLMLRRALDTCKNDLVVYKNKVHQNGFAAEMKTVITELKQYDIDDHALFLMQESSKANGKNLLHAKLQDIRQVYRSYEDLLSQHYHTQEDLLQAFARAVPDSSVIPGAHIYLDGFTGFTPVQYRVLQALLSRAADVTMTLTLPSEVQGFDLTSGEQFYLSTHTLQRLKQIAEQAGCQVQIQEIPASSEVVEAFLHTAADPYGEIRFVAGDILRRIREEHYRFRDFAVICSDMEEYHPVVREVFAEADISGFIDYQTELGNNAMARMLQAALQVVSERFSYAGVFAFLKCGLNDLTMDEICLLENYCLEFGIQGPRAWSSDFTANRRCRNTDPSREEPEYFWNLEIINKLRSYVYNSLRDLYFRTGGTGKTAGEITAALKDLIAAMNIPGRIQEMAEGFAESGEETRGKEYEQIPELMEELLNLIIDLMGGENLTAAEYARILSEAIDEIRISIIPPSLDAVMVGDLTRTRLDQIKVLYVVGANEGKLPAPPAEAGLFTRGEREFLKQEQFDLAPSVLESLYTQHFYLYLMFSKPSKALYLTCSSASLKGEELEPSYILEEAGEILPGLKLQTLPGSHEPLWQKSAALLLAERFRTLVENHKEAEIDADPEMKELLQYFYQQDPRMLSRMMAGALFQNGSLSLDHQVALDLYGEVLKGSVSRYETFYECPFRHFLNYGLDLQIRPEYNVQASDVGTVYHESLERYSRELERRGLTFRDVSDEESHEIARQCVEEASEAMDTDVLMSTQRRAFLLKRMIRVTEKTTDVLRMQVRDGLYEPRYFEMAFREEPSENAAFKGRIDRVDIYDAEDILVKIIDYKSGSKKFSIRDIYTGQQLQLTAYLKAAMDEVQKAYPDRTIAPGGIYYYLIQDRFVRDEKEAEEKFRMNGLTNLRPEALNAIDTTVQMGKSSKIAEISYTASGLSSKSKVANDQEFDHLMQFVQKKILDAGERIRNGEADIAPSYESSSHHACMYCDYHDVCKFEPGRWGTDYRRLPEDIRTEDIERELYGRH